MTRRMSCSLTTDAVCRRAKTVTRRHVDTWKNLRVGDGLTLIEKGMGLPKGVRQVVLAEVEVIDVRVEPIGCIFDEGVAGVVAEGFVQMFPGDFVWFWMKSHGYPITSFPDVLCRRIEWRYLEVAA